MTFHVRCLHPVPRNLRPPLNVSSLMLLLIATPVPGISGMRMSAPEELPRNGRSPDALSAAFPSMKRLAKNSPAS